MGADFMWSSVGGIIMNPSGDLALTNPVQGTIQGLNIRIKASLNGWQLYSIGADLQKFYGNVVDSSLENSIKQSVINSLQNQFLPSGSFQVSTLAVGQQVSIYIFLNQILAAQALLDPSAGSVSVQSVG